MSKKITVKLVNYRFDISKPEQAKEYSKLCEKLRARKLKFFNCWNTGKSNKLPDGVYEIETDFVFEDQYNTKTHRIHDWYEPIYPNKSIKEGYYLENMEALNEFKKQHYVCGYCAHRHNGHDAPINCTECLGSEYLKEDQIELTVMNPVLGPKRKATVTPKEYQEAQEKAAKKRAELNAIRLKEKVKKVLADAKKECEEVMYKAKCKAEVLNQGYDTDNLIYYGSRPEQKGVNMTKIINYKDYGFDDLYWLTAAMGQDDTRKALYQTIKVEVDRIIAVDGHRMHVLTGNRAEAIAIDLGLEVGCYKVEVRKKRSITLSKKESNDFPPIEQVIPNKENLKQVKLDPDANLAIAKIIRTLHVEGAINVEYVKDALGERFTYSKAFIDKEIGHTPVLFEDEYKLSVVMPMRNV